MTAHDLRLASLPPELVDDWCEVSRLGLDAQRLRVRIAAVRPPLSRLVSVDPRFEGLAQDLDPALQAVTQLLETLDSLRAALCVRGDGR